MRKAGGRAGQSAFECNVVQAFKKNKTHMLKHMQHRMQVYRIEYNLALAMIIVVRLGWTRHGAEQLHRAADAGERSRGFL